MFWPDGGAGEKGRVMTRNTGIHPPENLNMDSECHGNLDIAFKIS